MQNKLLFIGLPIYNSSVTLLKTLQSVQRQTYSNFMCLISDDYSRDDSFEIATAFANTDKRFQAVKHRSNLGLYKNFRFVWEQARGEYFMWLSADDQLSSNYFLENINFLNRNIEFVASGSRAVYHFKESRFAGPILEIDGDLSSRVNNYLKHSGWNHPVLYSIRRIDALNNINPFNLSYTAVDWNMDLRLLLEGRINIGSGGTIYIGTNGVSRGGDARRRFANNGIERMFPMIRFSTIFLKDVWRHKELRRLALVFCIRLNFAEIKRDLAGYRNRASFKGLISCLQAFFRSNDY